MSDYVVPESARIDLHTHSNRSDGTQTPTDVMRSAAEAGLDIVALTDHDITTSWDEARAACEVLGLGFIPGIEVTTRVTRNVPHKFSVHLLAYLPDPNHEELQRVLRESLVVRKTRLEEITNRLSEDFAFSWDDVLETLSDGKVAGRPAVADTMIRRGLIGGRGEFFDLVHKGSKYYVPNRGVPETVDAIALVRRAGGVPIIAHPMARGKEPEPGAQMPRAHFVELIEAGLAGFEIHHRDVPEYARLWLSELADEFGLIVTGSSDYHGPGGKDNQLGENTTEPRMLQAILEQSANSSLALLSNGSN